MEKQGLEEQKLKEELAEKKPEWKLYYDLVGQESMLSKDYWIKVIDGVFEQVAGDDEDRWKTLRQSFEVPQEFN